MVLDLDDRIAEAHSILAETIYGLETDGKEVVAVVGLFSGGNDSTVLCHLMRDRVTHLGHINTGIGIEQTRRFVRDTAAAWKVELIEEHGESYRNLVIERGFPGPAQHFKMYQRLKERGLRKIRRRFVTNGRRQRIIFVAGRRRDESIRRKNRGLPEREREGSTVWCSPIVNWTDANMAEYRDRFDVPRNEVSDMIHMSGECLCGSFAGPGELDEIGFFFPEMRAEIKELEREVEDAGHPFPLCVWGWGPLRESARRTVRRSGPMCSSCDARQLGLFDDLVD